MVTRILTPEQREKRLATQKRYRDSAKGQETSRRALEKQRTSDGKARRHTYYLANREQILASTERQRKQRLWQLWAYHGLRPEAWAALWAAQKGRCYLCGDPMDPEKRVSIDHDHGCCPKLRSCPICRRGLACWNCNIAIGHARDDPERLRRMADALEQAKCGVAERRSQQQGQLVLDAEKAD